MTSIRPSLFAIISHGNATQKGEVIESNSYTSLSRISLRVATMTPAAAQTTDNNALQDLGRATLQIVHDLKNQLNGLKLYATFLRKRLDRNDRSSEERETLVKLIAGLDRAAKDMTALVRYAQPVELHPQPRVDLSKIISDVVAQAAARETGGLPRATIAAQIEDGMVLENFDPAAMTEAIKAVTDDVRATVRPKGNS